MASTSPIIGVHLDLKGTMFKDSYIPQLLRDLAAQKVNAVLVEYEDIFPFEGIDIAYDRKTRWSKATLNRFLAEAKKNKIEVIPLIQCLGHLEYILGYDRYRKFAENYKYPSTIKVDDAGAVALVCEMLRQVIAAHPDSKYIHLGMDEAHAVHDASKRLKRPVLDLWLNHLRALLKVVEPTGKMPYIWTDMLEDHFRPDAFDDFRGRVIFGTWDYSTAAGDELPWARLVGGTRVSKKWLDEPENPAAPAIGAGTKWVEDYPADVKKLMEPYRNGAKYLRNFQIDLWSKLGMQCLPVSALRVSSNLSIMPPYNDLMHNVRGWSKAIKRTKQMGQIGTSWARGTSWCPPNLSIDLIWPLISEMSRSMGSKPKEFFPGIPAKTSSRIIRTLGRSRLDWRLEGRIADEMESLMPKLKEHKFEWKSMILMARSLELQRRADYNLAEVDFFTPNHRPVDSEWQRRLDEQKQTLKDIAAMKKQIRSHFGQRYHGDAFEEWIGQIFDVQQNRINDVRAICKKKLALAKKFYAR